MNWPFIPKPCGNSGAWAQGFREQFKKTLAERLIEPRISASRLRGSSHHYNIKLRATGFRVVHDVRDRELLVLVMAVGKRDRKAVYRQANQP